LLGARNDILQNDNPAYAVRKQMSKSVVVFTVSFIVLTAPYAFAGEFKKKIFRVFK
jgi:hypothetical protein